MVGAEAPAGFSLAGCIRINFEQMLHEHAGNDRFPGREQWSGLSLARRFEAGGGYDRTPNA